MIKAKYQRYLLDFKKPSGTSRGVLTQKETWFIKLESENKIGIGECAVFRGLSYDDVPNYEEKLQWVCENINLSKEKLFAQLKEYPSLLFGLETAYLSLENESPFEVFPSAFSQGQAKIPINGLIWMGDLRFMKAQIKEKIDQGFSCIKLKIGAIDFDSEISLLQHIRKEFSAKEIELRVDANGAFSVKDALEKIKRLAELDLHSIEQPIKPKKMEAMAALCEKTPLPIALDEELIGVLDVTEKQKMLQMIKPQYIILKPSLVGGFQSCDEWINSAERQDIGWWMTSALESNIGLNAIAQYTYSKPANMPQGLGTGSLFTNNIESPLFIDGEFLKYDPTNNWEIKSLFNK
ncbi:o-succinylbenzoate synthase [Mesonia sp. K7]|uniref:o-succinylbenzoate synthase n=1 Tax=Mesonia sp. K7 TaxID=2218606 RepID=UPI000DA87710|nr:o-succinylbenzoate synthase [Mesonia sp. K7]PZD77251.1 o-succinylbenzoate synthase [Mesonia sp. K7]